MKKILLLLVTMAVSLSAWAQQNVINTVTVSDNVIQSSTVYVGEVVVDGQSAIKYLYSADLTLYNNVIQSLCDCIGGMADSDYAALLAGHEFPKGFAVCSNPELEASMDANWSSAQYVGTLNYPDNTVKATSNSNLYDLDNGFKTVLDAKNAERIQDNSINNPANVEKSLISTIDYRSTDNVYYTIENGQIMKHVDTTIIFDCEATTFIYTKVELQSTMTGVEDINVSTAKNGVRYNMLGQPVGDDYKGIVIENGKKYMIK